MKLQGKVALVTGASRGIGRAIAIRLAQEGAMVCVNYYGPADAAVGKPEAAAEVVETIRQQGGEAFAYEADVSDEAQVQAMVEAVVARYGGLDILVNNAGICPFASFLEMPVALWDRVQAVNLRGAFLCSQAAARQMVKQGRGGRIVSISSISALVGGALQAHYTPTKAGIHSLMQSLAISLGPYGITCNSVMPGFIATDINRADQEDPEKRAYFERRIPVHRLGRPEDVANAVAFFCYPESDYINGASLLVDGGLFVNLQ